MNKKIKVIDLLNKIANGEEVPKEIKTNRNSYVFDENASCIENIYRTDNYMKTGWFNKEDFLLNDTVEIIEEEAEIDIQGIEDFKTNYAGDFVEKELAVYFNKKILPAIKQLDNQINNK